MAVICCVMLLLFWIMCLNIYVVKAVTNPNILNLHIREEIIRTYFHAGFSYNEIVVFLAQFHSIFITVRQLNRILRKLMLFRRHNHVTLNSTILAVAKELNGSASNFGYRLMFQRLRSLGFNVHRETIRLVLKVLDPEGVQSRKRHRFKRRKYLSLGPNYLWHMDGYDKLKPFGFGIHGAVDGYSRKILWLKVNSTNNNPKVIASYYLDCIITLKLLPRCVRSDRGTENVVVCGMQRFFRRGFNDESAGKKGFRYGPSTQNQRVESYWSLFRRNHCNWWINFFKDLCDEDVYDRSIPHQVECLRFCFTGILQEELDQTRELWNNHRIRNVRNSECPPGRPDVLYFTPQLHIGVDCKFPVVSDVRIAFLVL